MHGARAVTPSNPVRFGYRTFRHPHSSLLTREARGGDALLLLQEVRAPWWQWVLLSVSVSVLALFLSIGAIVLLWVQGLDPLDLMDYFELSRPPFIREGGIAAAFALLLAGQTLAPLMAIPFFRPARLLAFAWWRLPPDPRGMLRRVGMGLLLVLAVQVAWMQVDIPLRAEWRVLEHLTYAVVGGGQFWPRFWLVLAIGLVIPIAEEVLFRGLLFGLIRRRWGFWAGAVSTALLFGLAHGIAHALPTALVGLFLAWQVERDKSLLGAGTLHVLNNLGALVWMIIPYVK